MSWWEILLIIAAAGFVVAVIAGSYIRKKTGKISCDCAGCAGCEHCAMCARTQAQKQDKK